MSVNGNPSDTQCHCAAIRQAARTVTRFYDQALAPVGLRVTQYSLLATLSRGGPMTIGVLAGRMAMDRATLGHNLRPLQAAGLVAMRAGDDRRSRVVALTPDGEAKLREGEPVWRDAQRGFEAAFGRDDARALRSTMTRLARLPLAVTAAA